MLYDKDIREPLFDFLDDIHTSIFPIAEISGQIKKELLKKGGL